MRPAVVLLAALGLLAATASAGTTTYSLTATKACLVKKGTQVQSPQTGAQASLPPSQRVESLVGTLPVGSEPLFLYLAIGRNRSEAVSVRNALKKTIVPNPTAGNSWSGEQANAAWIVVSIAGTSPGASARKLVLSCLTKGKPPTSPASYDKQEVALCIQAKGRAAVVTPAAAKLLGWRIPPKLAPHLLFAFTSTSAQTKDGLRLFALFGKTRTDAVSLRSELDRALGGAVLGQALWTGSKKNVAWAASRIRGTTSAGIASGKRTLLSCLP
jgi:hypothetical protein